MSAPSQAYKSEMKVNTVSKNSLTRKQNLMMSAKISQFKDRSNLANCGNVYLADLEAELEGSIVILLFTCFKGFVVT